MFDLGTSFGYVSAIGGTWRDTPHTLPIIYRVKEARRTAFDFNHEFPDLWALDYFFQAGASVRVKTEKNPLWVRDPFIAHLYPPKIHYWEHGETGIGPIHSCWVIFRGGEHTGLARQIDPKLGFARFHDPQHRLATHMQALAREGQMYEATGFWRVQAMFLQLVDMLESARPVSSGLYEIRTEEHPPQVHPMVVGVVSYLQKHMAESITVEQLARDQHVSISALAHRYRAAIGEGPMKTLIRMRIQFAKELLIQGETLKTIAPKSGFCNEYHLSKVFKKIEGLSPRAFLKARHRST